MNLEQGIRATNRGRGMRVQLAKLEMVSKQIARIAETQAAQPR